MGGDLDCKVIYGDATDTDLTFVDCDDVDCNPGSVIAFLTLTAPRFSGAIQCLTSTNCKFSYYKGTDLTNPTVRFADCDVTNCFPSVTDAADPWTGQTNVTSVSLSLDTTNNRLYAHVIKDTSEQAYFKDTAKATISCGAETSYGFTAGDLGHISAPESGAGTSQIGVVLRQGVNFEFAVVPENLWMFLLTMPFWPKVFGKIKRKKK